MVKTLAAILADNWTWRKQIARLAWFELVKKSRGAVLSWAWFLMKPLMYVFCFWFALDIGLRSGSSVSNSDVPYLLWLCAGIIPWFFMRDMLGAGVDVLHRYSYLVNKIKFPISGISTIYTSAMMIIELMLIVILFIVYFACGMKLDVHLFQVPILLFLMFVFWDMVSILFSQLSAMSKDVANLMHAMTTPFFWLSGIIFDVKAIPIDWIQGIMALNPITFFASAFRAALCEKTWFWNDAEMMIGFAIVFIATLVLMLLAYKKLSEEVADVL